MVESHRNRLWQTEGKRKFIQGRYGCLQDASQAWRTSFIMVSPRNSSNLATYFREPKLRWINSSICSTLYHPLQDSESGERIQLVHLGPMLVLGKASPLTDNPPGACTLGRKVIAPKGIRVCCQKKKGWCWAGKNDCDHHCQCSAWSLCTTGWLILP